ncbi:MAG: hypothetical protein C0492_06150 [Verminephrobacter sp.]|nr:hypothetical protein [Verminephrobacter sp.]NUN59854.1 hypothetical protein [Burkholderiaceae bacterium]
MKYLVLLVVLVLGYAWWRGQRRAESPPPRRPTPAATPQDMVACAHCGVHLPRSEALTHGPRTYCCAEHQQEDAH